MSNSYYFKAKNTRMENHSNSRLYKTAVFGWLIGIFIFSNCSGTKRQITEQETLNRQVAADLKDMNVLMRGKRVYEEVCGICHGMKGEGGIANNLTDHYWVYGNRYENIVEITTLGMPAKGKMSFKNALPKQAISDVAIYIMSLEGTNPPGQKQAEGKLFPPAYSYYQNAAEKAAEEKEKTLRKKIAAIDKNGKIPVLFFTANWCKQCPEIPEWLKNSDEPAFSSVHLIPIETTTDPDKVNQYKLLDIPTLIRVDKKGKELSRSVLSSAKTITDEQIEEAFFKLFG
jgi:mono/diheme cytochrome c family protein